uniref:Mediator of RNA polymerase II transcription subunit 14 n=1 Tax=Tetraselmis sp. GSL018 TaxID=582737 RepID=A0A061QM80_9CHLO
MGSVLPEPQLRNLGEVSSLGTLLQVLVEESYGRIRTLVDQIQSVQEEEKQHRLLRYLFQYKQRLLRLVTLVRWMRKNPENMNSVSHCRKLLDVTARHQGIFQETADKLFFLWRDELQVFRAPIYDIPTAYEVLTTGTFASMPACLEELKGVDLPSAEEQRKASRRMDMLLRCCLLDAQLPEGVRVARTQGGVTTLRCEGMYEVGLTLVPLPREAEAERGAIPAEKVKSEGILGGGSPGTGPVKREEPSEPDGLGAQAVEQEPEEEQQQWRWCLVELVILPGSRRASQLTAQQDLQLREAIQARMWEESLAHRCPTEAPGAGPKQLYSAPLALMHRLLSDIASRLLIDNLVSTARQIANPSGGWENLLKLEPLSAGRSGISVTYWLGFPGIVQSASDSKAAEDSEKPQPPSIEVELRDGAVTATHNPPLTDPTTGLPVAVDVEPLSADAEKLLLGAASSYAYMQLHALAEELKSDRHKEKLEPIKGDVLLRRDIRRGHRGCLAQHEAKEDLVLPCIELVAGDDVMLIVQMRLRSGKLMLRPGQGLGGDIASDVSCFLKHEERRLHDIQESPGDAVQQRGRSTGADEPPASATALVVERLLSFLMKLSQRDSLAQIMVSCRPLLVQYMPSMPRHLFEACIACGSRSPSSYLAFPPIPLPPGFPLNRVFSTGSTNLQGASRLIEQYGRGDVHRGFGQGAALRFHLGLDVSMASSMRRLGEAPQPMPRFSLFVSSVSFRNVSLQPIRRIIVPPVTLEAARHRSASRLGKRTLRRGLLVRVGLELAQLGP